MTETATTEKAQAYDQQALDAVRAQYDEHEARLATYLERDLIHEERLNLGMQGLIAYCRDQGQSIAEFEAACDRMEKQLKDSGTVGDALVEAFSGKGA